MLKRPLFALFIFTFALSANAAAPSQAQVKEALYDRYAISQSASQLRNALESEVSVGACEPQGSQYRCQIENKKLGTTIPMLFEYDQSAQKWKFIEEIRN
jgi:hypothetical protein